MAKMIVPVDFQKPYIAAESNTTSNVIVHKIDGEAQYTTNDVNLMSDAAIAKYAASDREKPRAQISLVGSKPQSNRYQ